MTLPIRPNRVRNAWKNNAEFIPIATPAKASAFKFCKILVVKDLQTLKRRRSSLCTKQVALNLYEVKVKRCLKMLHVVCFRGDNKRSSFLYSWYRAKMQKEEPGEKKIIKTEIFKPFSCCYYNLWVEKRLTAWRAPRLNQKINWIQGTTRSRKSCSAKIVKVVAVSGRVDLDAKDEDFVGEAVHKRCFVALKGRVWLKAVNINLEFLYEMEFVKGLTAWLRTAL